jgi:hypothetical protein
MRSGSPNPDRLASGPRFPPLARVGFYQPGSADPGCFALAFAAAKGSPHGVFILKRFVTLFAESRVSLDSAGKPTPRVTSMKRAASRDAEETSQRGMSIRLGIVVTLAGLVLALHFPASRSSQEKAHLDRSWDAASMTFPLLSPPSSK